MTDLERLARAHGTGGWQTLNDMIRFGQAVQAAERKRFADMCALHASLAKIDGWTDSPYYMAVVTTAESLGARVASGSINNT